MEVWDNYWSKSEHSLYGRLCEIYRKKIMSNAVAYFFKKYFPKKGIFLEAGSGTSQTSVKIKKHERKLIALDISSLALKKTMEIPQIDYRVKASIFQLPFKDNSLDGVWDLGVLEHYTKQDITIILNEFRRVLKKGSYLILFWPPVFSLNGMALRTASFFFSLFNKKPIFYPGEITRLHSKREAKRIIMDHGFSKCCVYFPWRDLWGDLVLVCRK